MRKTLIILLTIMIAAGIKTAVATSFVTFNDGRLLVFPDTCVQSITQEGETLCVIAIDGTTFAYPMADVVSIEGQLTKEMPTITSFKFNNKYNYQVVSDAEGIIIGDSIHVEVAGIGKRLTPSFTLSDENAKAFVEGVPQESKVSRLRFDGSKVYTVGFECDKVLKRMSSGDYALVPFGRDYIVGVDFLTDHATSVPRIDINTVGGVNISSKVNYLDAEIIIDGAGVFPSMTDSVQVKGRGNYSWFTNPDAKNSYRLKFDHKVKPLGLTKGKNWVLLANYFPGSMMTNAIGMKVASLMGAVAANHIIPVDLYVNGTYKGSYNFTEKVGLANNSVDLEDESVATLLELDTYYDDCPRFTSAIYDIPVNVKKPDFGEDETLLTLAQIKEKFNNFLIAVDAGDDISNHVEIDPLARYLMVNEYIFNGEIFHPKSTFCYHENILADSCKFIFGPVWDLDWAFGFNGTSASTFYSRNVDVDYYAPSTRPMKQFLIKLHENPQVKNCIYAVWDDFVKNGLDELCEFCDDYFVYANPSFINNQNAGRDNVTYSAQVVRQKNWLRQRAAFISEAIRIDKLPIGDVDGNDEVSITDVTALIEYVLGGSPDPFHLSKADLNDDGAIDIEDVTQIIKIVLGGN